MTDPFRIILVIDCKMSFTDNRCILNYAGSIYTRNFRGVFDGNNLPEKPWKNESMIILLDNRYVCFRKTGDFVQFFDPAAAGPTIDILRYLSGNHLIWNLCPQTQTLNSTGYTCLIFLNNFGYLHSQ